MASSTADVAANTKSKKATAVKKAKASPSHPPFLQMITEAIVALKEKTGSSQYAITKYTEEKQKHLPSNFRKLLLFHLKKLVASNKLVKIKNSFKLAPSAAPPAKKPATTTTTTAVKPKPKTAAKPKAKAPAAAAAAKPKAKAKVGEKRKAAVVKPKAKPVKKSPAKGKPKKVAAAVVKKPKSVKKSPAKKATVKRAKK